MIKIILKAILFFIFGLMFFSGISFAQKIANFPTSSYSFYIIQGIFLSLVFFGYPLFCWFKKQNQSPPLKGLNLPKGSVRAMIAIAIIGSYLITLSIGPSLIKADFFDSIVSAFGSLVGAVIGFYFGSRNSEDNKNSEQSNK